MQYSVYSGAGADLGLSVDILTAASQHSAVINPAEAPVYSPSTGTAVMNYLHGTAA